MGSTAVWEWKLLSSSRELGQSGLPVVFDTNALSFVRSNAGADFLSRLLFGEYSDSIQEVTAYFPVSLVLEYSGAQLTRRRAVVEPWRGVANTDEWLHESWTHLQHHYEPFLGEIQTSALECLRTSLLAQRPRLSSLYLRAAYNLLDQDRAQFKTAILERLIISDLFKTLSVNYFRRRQLARLAKEFLALTENRLRADFLRLSFEMLTSAHPDFVKRVLKDDLEACGFSRSEFEPKQNSDLGDSELLEMALFGGSSRSGQQPVHVVTCDPIESVVARLKVARFAVRNLVEMFDTATGGPRHNVEWYPGYVTIVNRKRFSAVTLDVSTVCEIKELPNLPVKMLIRLARRTSYLLWRHLVWRQP
jgi:hypothetical protein